MRLLLAALIVSSLVIAGCVVTGDNEAGGISIFGKSAVAASTSNPTTTATSAVKATPKASVKPTPTPSPKAKPSCFMTADPWVQTGPFTNTVSALVENIPVNITNATFKCTRAEKAHNETIANNRVVVKCKYPQVWEQTNEIASMTAGSASCNTTVVIDPKLGPEINNLDYTTVNQTAVRMTWLTPVPANGSISYGTSGTNLGSIKNESTAWITSHTVTLASLSANTTYYYAVTSCIKNGGCTKSGIAAFSTQVK